MEAKDNFLVAVFILFAKTQLYSLANESTTYIEGHPTSRFFLKYQKIWKYKPGE